MRLVRHLLLMLAMVLLPMSGFAMPVPGQDACCVTADAPHCAQDKHPSQASADLHCCQIGAMAQTAQSDSRYRATLAQVWNPHREAAAITHTTAPPEHPPRLS